jgi:hypothetical protein
MSVPNTFTFSLQDVIDEIGSGDDLVEAFDLAHPAGFDPAYEGDHDRLLNFRNYTHVFSAGIGLKSGVDHDSIYLSDSVWSTVRGGSFGSGLDSGESFNVFANPSYTIKRTFLQFDLSALSGKTIISATLYMALRSYTGTPYFRALYGTQADSLSVGDYNNFSFTSAALSGTQEIVSQSSCSDLPYYWYIKASSGELAGIEAKFGSTLKLAILQITNDIANVAPTYNNQGVFFRSGEVSGTCDIVNPSLKIEYQN